MLQGHNDGLGFEPPLCQSRKARSGMEMATGWGLLSRKFKMEVIYVMAFLKLAGLFFTCLQQLGAFERIEK